MTYINKYIIAILVELSVLLKIKKIGTDIINKKKFNVFKINEFSLHLDLTPCGASNL